MADDTSAAHASPAPAPAGSPPATGIPEGGQLILVSLILVAAVANLNLSVANVALPSIGAAFDASQTSLDLVAVGYSLGLAASVLWLGAIGDRYGRKMLLLLGVGLSIPFCLLAAFAPSIEVLIVARIGGGVSAGMAYPTTLALITALWAPGPGRTHSIALWSALGGAIAALGPLVSGFLLEQFEWGSVFLVTLPLAFVALFMHLRTHPKPESIGQAGRWQSPYHDTMIDHDKNVGAALDKLDELGIADDTIVVYSTDNGPHMNSWPDAGMTPFRSEKNTNWEGAFRVPEMVRWPGKIAPGTVSNEIIQHHDWLPTFLAAAGEPEIVEKLKAGHDVAGTTFKVHIDGYNLLPYLTGEVDKSPRQGMVYFSDDGDVLALRFDNWKVVFMINIVLEPSLRPVWLGSFESDRMWTQRTTKAVRCQPRRTIRIG